VPEVPVVAPLPDMPAPTVPADTTPVSNPAPTAEVTSTDFTVAANAIDSMAALFAAMSDASKALHQVGRLQETLNDRQNQLNDLDSQIAQKQAKLDALTQDVLNARDYAVKLVTAASTSTEDAVNQANDTAQQLVAKAAATNASAQKQLDDMLQQGQAQINAWRAEATADATALNADLDTKRAELQWVTDELAREQAKLDEVKAQLAKINTDGATS